MADFFAMGVLGIWVDTGVEPNEGKPLFAHAYVEYDNLNLLL